MPDINYTPNVTHPDGAQWAQITNTTGATPKYLTQGLTPRSIVARTATLYADPGNSDTIIIGPTPDCSQYELEAGSSYAVEGDGISFNLTNWFFHSDTNAQTLRVLWI